MKANAKTDARHDAVFIRVSSPGQDEKPQKANVATQLKNLGIHVQKEYWFSCVVPRRNVSGNAAFTQLMDLVKVGKIGTVYIESQKRFGTDNNRELLHLLEFFSANNTRLYDLHQRIDLAEDDESTELRVILGGQSSKRERNDISFQSLRTRVNKLKETGSWPNGCQPFGFAKQCYSSDGKLLWRFDPVSRTLGYMTEANANGQLSKSETNPKVEKIRRKQRGQICKLVPSANKQHVKTVQLIFDYFTRQGLSRRNISLRLNQEGRTYYDKPFTHALVSQILANPAYVGDTHFGKVQSGILNTLDPSTGEVVKLKRGTERHKRPVAEQLVRAKTHEGLIDRKTWTMAQKRIAADAQRPSYTQNPKYYLNGVFTCGHCGGNMSGRTENGEVVYVCSTYTKARSAGQNLTCGYHRIRHEDAERMLFDKITEHDLPFDDASSDQARESLRARLEKMGMEDKESFGQWQAWLEQGLTALAAYLDRNYKLTPNAFKRLRAIAGHFYWDDYNLPKSKQKELPITLAELRNAIRQSEAEAANEAKKRLADALERHESLTKMWIEASELQRPILKKKTDELEVAIKQWEPLTTSLTERFQQLAAVEENRHQEILKLRDEWPTLEAREKGAAFKRLFRKVTLYWQTDFVSASEKPTRPKKTDRPGRNRNTLKAEKTSWEFAESDMACTW